MISRTKIPLKLSTYYGESDAFFTYSKFVGPNRLYTCREQFAYSFNKTRTKIGYVFYGDLTNSKLKAVNRFFQIIDNRLNLKRKTVIYKTKYKNVLVFKVNKFWTKDSFRRSMFTLLLRCACQFYKSYKKAKTFYKALRFYDLTNSIKPVIFKFLNGYTNASTKIKRMMNNFGGIVDAFGEFYTTEEQLAQLT